MCQLISIGIGIDNFLRIGIGKDHRYLTDSSEKSFVDFDCFFLKIILYSFSLSHQICSNNQQFSLHTLFAFLLQVCITFGFLSELLWAGSN